MSKDIRDYIHFYLGCEFANSWFPEYHKEFSRGWKLTAIDYSNPRPFRLEETEDYTWTDSVKPILRKLESMTPEDIAGLAIAYGMKDFVVTKANCEGHIIQMEYLKNGESQTDFIHWYVYQLNANVFHYLISQGFDLFGLIDAGLAIDKSTLK